MDVAVADVAERQRTRAGNERGDGRVGLPDEGRHGGDRHRDIVLDRAALVALHLAEHLADAPEALGLFEALGRGRVGDQAALKALAEDVFEHRAQARARLRGQLDQHVPRMRLA